MTSDFYCVSVVEGARGLETNIIAKIETREVNVVHNTQSNVWILVREAHECRDFVYMLQCSTIKK